MGLPLLDPSESAIVCGARLRIVGRRRAIAKRRYPSHVVARNGHSSEWGRAQMALRVYRLAELVDCSRHHRHVCSKHASTIMVHHMASGIIYRPVTRSPPNSSGSRNQRWDRERRTRVCIFVFANIQRPSAIELHAGLEPTQVKASTSRQADTPHSTTAWAGEPHCQPST